MTKQEIKEGNKIIAKFMNYDRYAIAFGSIEGFLNKGRYHSSWDWLMSVVDKLESTGQTLFFGEIESEGVYEKILKFHSMPLYGFGSKKFPDTKIQATWRAVVELIIAINKNKEDEIDN